MQFRVPQYIDVEDKIFGPFTFKQFMYLAGGAGLCFILYVYIPYLVISIIPIAAVAILSLALTFLKYNGRPFAHVLEAFFKYLMTKKLYVWKKEAPSRPATNMEKQAVKNEPTITIPKLTDSKLKELAWSLDVKKEE